MPYSNYLKPIYGFAVLLALIKLGLAVGAPGGVDINVYWNESVAIDYSNSRYFREPVSWEIVRWLGAALKREDFLIGFTIVILGVSVARLGVLSGLLLYSSFLSPFGVMLEFNILRQGIATLFLAMFMISLANNRRLSIVVLGILALLSHNSAFIVIAFVVLFTYLERMKKETRLFVIGSALAVIAVFQFVGGFEMVLGNQADSFRADAGGAFESNIYLAVALMFCVFLYFFTQQAKWRPIALGLASASLFGVLIAFVVGLDPWVYGRIAISNVVLCQFLLFFDSFELGRLQGRRAMGLVAIAVTNVALIGLHPGASDMISATEYLG